VAGVPLGKIARGNDSFRFVRGFTPDANSRDRGFRLECIGRAWCSHRTGVAEIARLAKTGEDRLTVRTILMNPSYAERLIEFFLKDWPDG
jgi:hypothetical protein